jgi:FkbM family methyltransferase
MGIVSNNLQKLKRKWLSSSYYYLLYFIFLATIKKRNQEGRLRFGKINIKYNDITAFVGMYHEIYFQQHYKFIPKNKQPVIIDCGANIGLSVIYFHQLIPDAKIIAIEADPNVASILEYNLRTNHCQAEVITKAVWNSDDEFLSFSQAGADAGSFYGTEKIIQVPTIRLQSILAQFEEIELIKIDIEGAEVTVVEDSYMEFKKANKVFIEFHSFDGQVQKLDQILGLLSSVGFRYKILQARHMEQPFIPSKSPYGMDLQLNIFFYKE